MRNMINLINNNYSRLNRLEINHLLAKNKCQIINQNKKRNLINNKNSNKKVNNSNRNNNKVKIVLCHLSNKKKHNKQKKAKIKNQKKNKIR